MLSLINSFQKRNWIPFLLSLCFLAITITSSAQTNQPVYIRVVLQKVAPGHAQEFEKLMKENIKPAHQLRKQSGKITSWRFFKVHFAGSQDDYNYVGVSYYDSWAKTEGNDNWPELIKAANPEADVAAITSRIHSLRTVTQETLFNRVDFVSPKNPVPFKYILVNFMKVKEGMFPAYLKAEQEDWKPVHQALVDGGSRVGWNLWELVLPGGTNSTYDYVTANIYSTYDKLNGESYEEAFKKVHPGKDIQAVFDQTSKTLDAVRAELWELIDSL